MNHGVDSHSPITAIHLSNSESRGRAGLRLQETEIEIDDVSRRATAERFRRPRTATRGSGKEVIQPQVPLRLPCYDFAPVTALAFGRLLPGRPGLRDGLRALTASMA